ncbi:hypothetical protein Ocin01_18325 [Orchesella cincta]|uniref:F-box domain-containing protein n=1 Tax=Orchesella cincta TaxID=48709 RepID=A0A1D2M5V3_ORCCI|nr:hypothetical protein Ocin01_18325 [Orchesella cincta]
MSTIKDGPPRKIQRTDETDKEDTNTSKIGTDGKITGVGVLGDTPMELCSEKNLIFDALSEFQLSVESKATGNATIIASNVKTVDLGLCVNEVASTDDARRGKVDVIHGGIAKTRKKAEKNDAKQPIVGVVEVYPRISEDAWKDILNLLNPTDKLNCFRAHSMWRTYLKSKRTVLLFSEVLSLINKDLPEASLLQMRSTCKMWREDIDNTFLPEFSMYFETAENIRQFLDDMQGNFGNPFPGRIVKLHNFSHIYKDDEDLQDDDEYWNREANAEFSYWQNANELLETYGHHIRTLSIAPNDMFEIDMEGVPPELKIKTTKKSSVTV